MSLAFRFLPLVQDCRRRVEKGGREILVSFWEDTEEVEFGKGKWQKAGRIGRVVFARM